LLHKIKVRFSGGVSNVDIDGNNALQIKTIGVVISTFETLDIIANNPIDQKVVEFCSSQHSPPVEHAMYRSVFPPQGVEDGVFLPASPRAS
jgi:hypothetical protein